MASPDVVTSPISGARGAFVWLELLEEDASLGSMILGDLVTFEEIATRRRFDVVVRRARFTPVLFGDTSALRAIPPELAPLLRAARGRGAIGVSEEVVRQGTELRIRLEEPITLLY